MAASDLLNANRFQWGDRARLQQERALLQNQTEFRYAGYANGQHLGKTPHGGIAVLQPYSNGAIAFDSQGFGVRSGDRILAVWVGQ